MKMIILKNLLCFVGLLSCQNNAGTLNHNQTNTTITMNNSKHLEVNGMTVDWHYRNNRVFFTISAPTEGWVTLGFNEKDDIVGTNLIFCRVVSGKVEVVDHFTVSMGNHQPTEKLGGTSVFKDISGEEKGGKTTVSFSMLIEATDKFHFDLTQGTSKWFICAFSAEDDFYHHSRMREHRQVKL